MPPVFGPVSPSPTRLWSCAEPSGSAVVAVAQREQRDFLADQAFLDHHRRAGLAERALFHHGVDGGQRLGLGGGDHHALAGGEPIRLDHDRRAAAADEFAGGLGVVEALP